MKLRLQNSDSTKKERKSQQLHPASSIPDISMNSDITEYYSPYGQHNSAFRTYSKVSNIKQDLGYMGIADKAKFMLLQLKISDSAEWKDKLQSIMYLYDEGRSDKVSTRKSRSTEKTSSSSPGSKGLINKIRSRSRSPAFGRKRTSSGTNLPFQNSSQTNSMLALPNENLVEIVRDLLNVFIDNVKDMPEKVFRISPSAKDLEEYRTMLCFSDNLELRFNRYYIWKNIGKHMGYSMLKEILREQVRIIHQDLVPLMFEIGHLLKEKSDLQTIKKCKIALRIIFTLFQKDKQEILYKLLIVLNAVTRRTELNMNVESLGRIFAAVLFPEMTTNMEYVKSDNLYILTETLIELNTELFKIPKAYYEELNSSVKIWYLHDPVPEPTPEIKKSANQEPLEYHSTRYFKQTSVSPKCNRHRSRSSVGTLNTSGSSSKLNTSTKSAMTVSEVNISAERTSRSGSKSRITLDFPETVDAEQQDCKGKENDQDLNKKSGLQSLKKVIRRSFSKERCVHFEDFVYQTPEHQSRKGLFSSHFGSSAKYQVNEVEKTFSRSVKDHFSNSKLRNFHSKK